MMRFGSIPQNPSRAHQAVPEVYRFLALCLVLWLAVGATAADSPSASQTGPPVPPDHAKKMAQGLELFKTDVRGLLTQHCITCHGGDKVKGDLDLTTREGLLRGGASGPAIVPGKAAESRLYKLITHAEKPHMPQKAAKLSDPAIARIATWIDAGAPYDKPLREKGPVAKGRPNVTEEDRQFWSFQPLKQVTPPSVKNQSWCRTPIDPFVLARLEARGLTGNPPADRRHLIRRAFFDLIGLPPTPQEVEAFLNDPAPDAFEKLIDRLLANPHYGERWGRHWLDLARFAESHGYEQDYDRPSAYHFRDFVIKALNEDMPYDQFVKWQIAGDELEPDNPPALMATGYLAAGTHATQITANQVEKERYDELDDMAATIGTSMLGVTIGCARCHDHKFDPIPQKDYYRLVSTFTTTVRSELDLDLHPERYRRAKAEFDRRHAPLVAALERFENEQLPRRLDNWLKTTPRPPQPRWLILEPVSFKSKGGATLTRLEDASYLVSGTNPASDTYTVVAHTPLQGITAVRLEALAHPSMVKGGPGRASNGNFALSDFRLTVTPLGAKTGAKTQPMPVKLVNPMATFEQKGLPVKAAIDDDKKSAWAVDPQFGKDHAAVFELEKPIGFEGGTILTFTLKFENNTGHNIGRPRLAVSTLPNPACLTGDQGPHHLVLEIQRILQTPAERWTAEQKAALQKWYRTTDPDWQKLHQAVQDHLHKAPQPHLTKILVASEGVKPLRLHTQGADFFDKTYFLKRGDLNQKEGEAPQSFLQVLMRAPEGEKHWQVAPPPGWRTSYRRRSLANWITDTEAGAGPLLARVIVNRVWQHHLGRGIVATPSDFGAQGERPTHPALLDWLAGELIRQGWRLKPIHKLIMTSAVYRQSAGFDPGRASVDPNNTLYGQWSRRRLEGEVIRDAMLAVSGGLDQTMFGPGTLNESHRRRSIYFTIKRSQLIPMMILFDGPDTLQSMPSRPSTTTAPQAMALMNHPQVRAYARAFGQRLLPPDKGSLAEAVRTGYLLALGRLPGQDELAETLAFLQRQAASYRAGGKQEALELALADFCQALMSLNEFVYVD
jgi:mono/diheme cytochrome c family protein